MPNGSQSKNSVTMTSEKSVSIQNIEHGHLDSITVQFTTTEDALMKSPSENVHSYTLTASNMNCTKLKLPHSNTHQSNIMKESRLYSRTVKRTF